MSSCMSLTWENLVAVVVEHLHPGDAYVVGVLLDAVNVLVLAGAELPCDVDLRALELAEQHVGFLERDVQISWPPVHELRHENGSGDSDAHSTQSNLFIRSAFIRVLCAMSCERSYRIQFFL